jgi:Polysaccharide pyruvyl transferase
MDSNREARVLVRTLPLSAGNYGGILQAYALQQVLMGMGLSPATDLTVSNPKLLAHSAARMAVRTLPSWVFNSGQTADLQRYVLDLITSQTLTSFVEEYIAGVSLYGRRGQLDKEVLDRFDKFVAGSDQVWRWGYGDVRSYLFDFVDNADARIISYAASFGHDKLTGREKYLTQKVRPAARRFRSISVREVSGVQVCSQYWGISALHHVDPTMLLDRAHYASLAENRGVDLAPECLTFVLDESDENKSLIDRICTDLSMTATSLAPKPRSYSAWREDPDRFLKPTVHTWLKAFSDARFVVTDSFHGTVFAVLNNKPFIAITNKKRGAGRFDSLLGMLGLNQRLVSSAADDVQSILEQKIDWRQVNQKLAIKRDEGLSYLREALLST